MRKHCPERLWSAFCCVLVISTSFLSTQTNATQEPKDEAVAANVSQMRLMNADREPENWFTTGRDLGEQHYSPLAQINEHSVVRLGFAWEYDVGSRRSRVEHPLEATPVVVDGVMYASGAWGVVYALDAAAGRELWRFDPEIDTARARLTCCSPVNRGVAVRDGKVYVGQIDGWLVALDAASGKVVWKVDTIIDRKRAYSITGAPRIAGDKILIGNAGADFGVRGYITAYDLESGAQRWRFFTVPGDPKFGYEQPELALAAKTWDADSNWAAGGGGTVWDGMAYDPVLNLLYVGTANGSPIPVWLRSPRTTANLFLASILAIHPDTGRMAWYYQTTPGESWDYDATQPMILADLYLKGKKTPVLMHAPKNGFFYVLDRASGKLISAQKFTKVTWAKRVVLATGRPLVNPDAGYQHSPKLIYPQSAHEWWPMAFSRDTGFVYIPVFESPSMLKTSPNWHYRPTQYDWGGYWGDITKVGGAVSSQRGVRMTQSLLAWDPVRQRSVWRVGGSGGGVLATSGGLVFQGDALGNLNAYRTTNGKLLKSIFAGTGIAAAPMTYAVNGIQYIAVMAGNGGYVHDTQNGDYSNRGRLLAFRLEGGPTPLPATIITEEPYPLPTRLPASAEILAKGRELFVQHCVRCHGGGLSAERSAYPNLFNLPTPTHENFKKIVLEGLLAGEGMGSFADLLSVEDADAIHAWLIDTAYRQRNGESTPPIIWTH